MVHSIFHVCAVYHKFPTPATLRSLGFPEEREKELVLFPTNLTFFWDREILCASTQVGHLQVQLPLAGLCRLCCAWVSFPFSFFFFLPPKDSFYMFFFSISNERSTSPNLDIDLISLICLFEEERIGFFFFWLYMFFV